MILTDLWIDPAVLRSRTGWELKPEGACKAGTCVPLPAEAIVDGKVDARALADRLGMPLVAEERRGLWALGPEGLFGRTLATAEAPELVLPDLEGRPFTLSSLRGQKVALVAWASW
jgi:hypothetical protein